MGLFDKILKEGKELVEGVATEENKEKVSSFFKKVGSGLEEAANTVKEKIDEVNTEENKEKVSSFFKKVESGIKEQFKDVDFDAMKKEQNKPMEFTEEQLDEENNTLTCEQKILDCLATKFPQYEVLKDVSPASMGGTGRFMNYSIVVCQGDAVKLCIMLIGKTTTAHREYRWSREFAEKNGIPFINFVRHFPNLPEYIEQRLHKYL